MGNEQISSTPQLRIKVRNAKLDKELDPVDAARVKDINVALKQESFIVGA